MGQEEDEEQDHEEEHEEEQEAHYKLVNWSLFQHQQEEGARHQSWRLGSSRSPSLAYLRVGHEAAHPFLSHFLQLLWDITKEFLSRWLLAGIPTHGHLKRLHAPNDPFSCFPRKCSGLKCCFEQICSSGTRQEHVKTVITRIGAPYRSSSHVLLSVAAASGAES